MVYDNVVCSFSKSIANPELQISPLTLATSTMLSLFEVWRCSASVIHSALTATKKIVHANESQPSSLTAHVGGIAAMLRVKKSVSALFKEIRNSTSVSLSEKNRLYKMSVDFQKPSQLLSIPPTCPKAQSLDQLVLDFVNLLTRWNLLKESAFLTVDERVSTRLEAVELDLRLASWEETDADLALV